ncbi:Squamous cell carcinoma antigen recognized by T-cell 3 [Dorcoceras hygrometricum]|uniref:Squamous cell carcinoma antigen recognized by T-cell 3 n=1 Tax=Dorcoceras hygrometricum TaxID=472368 RepID=A0A2Z7CTH1_9LAMI|nr:Squamous cell carcinoma antigen recognized by T-cell 3 [Dorcoceras hygrometricum]
MAQYQILARNPFGPPGTGPKQTLEVKNSVSTPPPAQRAAQGRKLRAPPHTTRAHGGGHLRAQRAWAPGSDQIHRETGTSMLAAVDLLIRSTTGNRTPSSVCTRRADEFDMKGISTTSIGYPRIKASGESSTTKHRLLHASGPHPIPPPNDPK